VSSQIKKAEKSLNSPN